MGQMTVSQQCWGKRRPEIIRKGVRGCLQNYTCRRSKGVMDLIVRDTADHKTTRVALKCSYNSRESTQLLLHVSDISWSSVWWIREINHWCCTAVGMGGYSWHTWTIKVCTCSCQCLTRASCFRYSGLQLQLQCLNPQQLNCSPAPTHATTSRADTSNCRMWSSLVVEFQASTAIYPCSAHTQMPKIRQEPK